MAKKGRKAAYVVFQGRQTGIFTFWAECEAQVKGFPGNSYKSYETQGEAEAAWNAWREAQRFSENKSSSASKNIEEEFEQLVVKYDPISDPATFEEPRTSNFTRKRSAGMIIDLTASSDIEDQPDVKKQKKESSEDIADTDPMQLQEGPALEVMENQAVKLTAAQQAVANLAQKGYSLFLTGAAGSGKTVTLREIIKLLKKGVKNLDVQVIAPTGIAALPLDGKTTYSFAGWNPNSFKEPMVELLKNIKPTTAKSITKVNVIIIEEISMVESQFLERLNLLLQHIMGNKKPFAGKQVIFVGDFHQLPPVKPFEHCLECGEPMTRKGGYICTTDQCVARNDEAFAEGDKWAFRAPIWAKLKLKHVRLEQIHRQKDTRFQDILNKIRNGIALTNKEWMDLERRKHLPDGAFAVRLMSRLKQVNEFNKRQIDALKSEEKVWKAYDNAIKKDREEEDKYPPRSYQIANKLREHKESLKDHRFPSEVKLKVGAKVVLLHNLNHKGGLVNGSQGQVVGFANTANWPEKKEGDWQQQCFVAFQEYNGYTRPIVKFTNGTTQAIPHVTQDSIKGPAHDRYLVSRTQIPLALAWALSIHKSQGMTLQHAEVSSKDIFESGQLYVGLSRVTSLEGLTVTGFLRKQQLMDEAVLKFYENTKWEDSRSEGMMKTSIFGKCQAKDEDEMDVSQGDEELMDGEDEMSGVEEELRYPSLKYYEDDELEDDPEPLYPVLPRSSPDFVAISDSEEG